MPAKRIALFAVLLAVLAVAVTAAYLQRAVPETQATWPSLPYQSEDEWIVSQTAVSVIDLAQFARTGSPVPLSTLAISRMKPDSTRPGLTFRIGARDVSIDLSTHVWDPDAYVALAKKEGASANGVRQDNDGIVAALLDLKVDSLRVQNDVVSIALQRDYRNPANHEAAALLLGVFALREAAGYFYDPRLVLSRAAAHLAVARAMRSGSSHPSEAGQLAAIMIEIDAGRTGPAIKKLDVFERDHRSTAVQSWARALRRRATLDWRVPAEDDAPLIERLEYMRSLARMISVSRSLEYITEHHVEPIPDWGWRSMDFPLTVENGHVFVDDTVRRTLNEATQVLGISPSAPPADLAAVLSREPAVSSIGRSSARGIEVLDQGTWSSFYQRELAHVAMEGSDFYRAMLGLSEGAAEFEQPLDALMATTPLWPIVLRLRLESECRCGLHDESKRAQIVATYRDTMAHVAPIINGKPQLMPYLAWSWIVTPPPTVKAIDTVQQPLWFRTIYPTGTAFESRRMNGHAVVPNDFVAHAEAIHELSPWDPIITINWSIVRCHKRGGCTPAQERANFANIADYSLTIMRMLADKAPDRIAAIRQNCSVVAEDCWTLGDVLKAGDRFAEAADAYREYFRREPDRVAASNNIEWLIRYDQKTGKADEARRVATEAEEVGSGGGMQALAGYLERKGDYAGAEKLYRTMFERYENGASLLSFLLRRAEATRRAPDGPEYTSLVQRYFDGKLDRVDPASLSGKPERGLFVTKPAGVLAKAGFQHGDIIAAMDGVRVYKTAQSGILCDRSFDGPLHYDVWRGNHYVRIDADLRKYYYAPPVTEYPPIHK